MSFPMQNWRQLQSTSTRCRSVAKALPWSRFAVLRSSSSERLAAVVRIRSFAQAWNRTKASRVSASMPASYACREARARPRTGRAP
jgi:hypothetical protein